MEPEETTQILRTFYNPHDAQELVSMLEAQFIPASIDAPGALGPASWLVNVDLEEIHVKVRPKDLKRAQLLMQEMAETTPVEESSMLEGMSNEELHEVLVKREEWDEEDVVAARRLLQRRGITLTEEALAQARQAYLEEKFRPQHIGATWVVVGYLFSVVGGALGILLGLALVTLKRTRPDGKKVFTYAASDRRHGKRMLVISVIMAVLILLLRVVSG